KSNWYLHYDWSHRSAERRAGQNSPLSPNYRGITFPTGAYSQGNVRFGTRVLNSALDLSLFVNNVTNAHPLINPNYTNFKFYWDADTLQPRTYGLTVVWRH